MKTCKLKNCNGLYVARGYCNIHYRRFMKNGSPYKVSRIIDPTRQCNINGCENKYRSLGYCDLHYNRFRIHGNPLKVTIRTRNICNVKGCTINQVGYGFCSKHYSRFKRYGHPLKKPIRIKRVCIIDNCNNIHKGHGFCSKHYQRFKTKGDPLKTECIMEHEDLCSIRECNNKYSAKGFCKDHYMKNNLDMRIKSSSKYRMKNRYKINLKQKINNELYPEKLLESQRKSLTKYGKLLNMNPHEYMYALISWSKTIKKLDNKMCKNCDSIENLHAHHIQPKSLFPKLILNIDNGITLCKKCHYELHWGLKK